MDRPPADQPTSRLPACLSREARLHRLPVVCGHVERARVAQEVGQVEQVDVQRMALDPLAAVQEPAQGPDLRLDLDAEGVLDRMDGGHLVRDRADPADPGHDVDDLVGGPSDDELLEVARRLEDLRWAASTAPSRTWSGSEPSPSTRVSRHVDVEVAAPRACHRVMHPSPPVAWAAGRAGRRGRR